MKYASLKTLALAATILATPLAASAQETVLKMVPNATLRLLDPLNTTAYVTRNHGYMVFDTLFSVDENSKPQPQMVDTWSISDDRLVYNFTLRDGLKFHDDAAVTTDDVVASLQRWMKKDATGQQIALILASVEAVDAKTFTIKLKEPFGPLIDTLAKPSSFPAFIMPKRIVETAGEQGIQEIVGSGPYRFLAEEFRPGVSAAYARFDGYVPRSEPANSLSGGKVAKVDRVEWLTFPDLQTTVNALTSGEIDLIETMSADLLPNIQDAPGVKYGMRAGTFTPVLRINWLQKPFDNVKMRQAVAAMISQEEFMAATIGDPETYKLCPSLYGCESPLTTDVNPLGMQAPDLEKAKALMAEAGYNGEEVVILDASDVPSFAGLATITAQYLRQSGMNVKVQTMDFSTYLAQRTSKAPVAEGGWSIAFGGWYGSDLSSPLSNLNLDTKGNDGYVGWSSDEEISKLKVDFARAATLEEQKVVAAKIQERANELIFFVPLGTYYQYTAYRDNVTPPISSAIPVVWGIEKK
ncbi:ABC transporter substrate-binding protein [Tianweitania populi]|uniref:ABC transporter substrate-binding protein n=1 Tax=Tianweitania populi TaxID=1607949 RepID=A0A8J3GMU4_9HYPH|nr:ABC transporter substrate-binding protein [Tianweitania populi]GHD20716.1 ABC transporter substrate-binding protein [Tianweitania populi]